MSRPASWKERRLRAQQLIKERSHAAELLAFYGRLLELQEPLYQRATAASWYDAVRADANEIPRLHLRRLAISELLADFQQFVTDVITIATEVLADIGQSLEASSGTAHTQLLEDFLSGKSADNLPTTFFPRAYLEPLIRALAERCESLHDDDNVTTTCPRCGWLPHLSILCDEPEIKGRRQLVCALCGHWWPVRRATCVKCHESRTDKLIYHESEVVEYIRVEECASCASYIKSVDLRKNGVAVPDVDDVASVELDLWAQERGLTRTYRNVLGL